MSEQYGNSKQIRQKAWKVWKGKGLQFRIKKGLCLKVVAANCKKEETGLNYSIKS
jgi:hypothetical protein